MSLIHLAVPQSLSHVMTYTGESYPINLRVVSAEIEEFKEYGTIAINHPALMLRDGCFSRTFFSAQVWYSLQVPQHKLILMAFHQSIKRSHGNFMSCKNHLADTHLCIEHLTHELGLWPNWEDEV